MARYSVATLLFGLTMLLGLAAWGASTGASDFTPNESLPPGVVIEQVTVPLTEPVALAFDPAGRLFLAQRNGKIRLIDQGVLQPSPVITFEVDACLERGLQGLAVDPDFEQNHFVYVQYTDFTDCRDTESIVVRFEELGGVGINPTTIFSSTFTGTFHTGNNIHFGPDGKLYISTGDNYDARNAQNVTVKHGKMHRINPDGSIPADNPVFTQTGALPSLYAIGLRNSYDFTFDTVVTGRLWVDENGPSCDDELNRVVGGWNYGWRYPYQCNQDGLNPTYNTIAPMWYLPSFDCCRAPTGIEVYSGTLIPEWQDELFMCTYTDAALHHFYLNEERRAFLGESRVDGVSCNMDLQTGPDGALYYIQGGGVFDGWVNRLTRAVAPTVTHTPTRTATSTPTDTALATETATGTATGAATETATASPTPNGSETPTPTLDLSTTPTETGTATATETPTEQPTETATPTATLVPSTCELVFEDVPIGSPFYQFVQCLACKNILRGYPCGGEGEPCNGNNDPYFRTYAPITRGQLAKIVSNSSGFNDPTGFAVFEDVPEPTNAFFIWVQRLANRGIMSGYPCGGPDEPCVPPGNKRYFRPNAQATRGQIAKIVSNTAGFNDPPGVQVFEDVPPGHTFYDFVQRLANRSVIGGYACGEPGEPCVPPQNMAYFRPNTTATRGQVSKIVSNTFFPECGP